MKVLVTGAAGFIGMHVVERLIAAGHQVGGVDNVNDYYSVELKQDRLTRISALPGFEFYKLDLSDAVATRNLFEQQQYQRVIHLAAQPGVRYSLVNPHAYIQSNIVGFLNVLEGCRHHGVEHLVYASSSSVYGANVVMPFRESDAVDHPVSLYAATKKSNELMAHTYSHLYDLPTTGLRFFTVYGPWGRPDMSPSLFASAILARRPIDVFNEGKMQRDFTYIDDIVEGVMRVFAVAPTVDPSYDPAEPDPASSHAPFRVYNIGHHSPVELMTFIAELERALGKKAVMNMLPMQPGDVVATYADIERLRHLTEFEPRTSLADGLKRFAEWYQGYAHH